MEMIDEKNIILELSRQNQVGKLSPWFDKKLDDFLENFICDGDPHGVADIGNYIISDLVAYREQTGMSKTVIGMSGGVDSALTAVLFKKAGWEVIGVVMPIHQDAEETNRGIEACEALDIQYIKKDLSRIYDMFLPEMVELDAGLAFDNKSGKIRRGNIRARLRMITLYNLAASLGGLVASTDNYSELAVGFWTLHGDVGDLSPIQSLFKSWEVPLLAKEFGVPESIWRAKPTDGLGVDDGDEAQFGFTYLELDLMLLQLGLFLSNGLKDDDMKNMGGVNRENLFKIMDGMEGDEHAIEIFHKLLDRMGSTWFKRVNPVNIEHPTDTWSGNRYARLENIDRDLFWPAVMKKGQGDV